MGDARTATCPNNALCLCELGMDYVRVFLPLVLFYPHLCARVSMASYTRISQSPYLFERAQSSQNAATSPRGVDSLWWC